jgi:phospholipase D1/2
MFPEDPLERIHGTYRLEGHQKALLHGYLHIQIIKCENLRNLDCNAVCAPSCLAPQDVSDPFVTVHAGTHRLAKTSLKANDLNPLYNEDFFVPVAHFLGPEGLRFAVSDDDFNLYSQLIGETFLPMKELLKYDDESKPLRVGVHKVAWLDKKPHHGSVEYFVDFLPMELFSSSMPMEVPGVYFKKQTGNYVKLYVNADDGRPGLPQVRYGPREPGVTSVENGVSEMIEPEKRVWQPQRLWRDIYDAICQAQDMIYITGWSVDVTQSLLRGTEKEEALKISKYSPYIGELLKQKAGEGVTVNLLVWDDATSNIVMPGVMGTHDEVARRFFANTQVHLRLAPMQGDERNNIHEKAGKFVMFTHHQKLVIVDTPQTNNAKKRELLAFIGGIDLTNGRWDTNEHPLFRSLTTDHQGDCHNACFAVDAQTVGPREPWHDIHSSVRGPGVLDIVQNFTERWKMQAQGCERDLVDLEKLGLADPPAYTGKDAWCTQLFRSIDARTALFDQDRLDTFTFTKVDDIGEHFSPVLYKGPNLKEMLRGKQSEFNRAFATRDISTFRFDRDLTLKKGRNIDDSVHSGILHHIRRAEHSVYIESQYFLSSSHLWGSCSKTKCGNLVAAELTLKILSKIEANEPFCAYILVPMWPEGIPDSGAVQAILRFQTLTMESMYTRIVAALRRRKELAKKNGTAVPDAHAQDYLNFYCLATRETSEGDTSAQAPKPKTDEETLSKTRRHLIYVHSKMVIVDDAIAIIGSANINQRSLDGARDSEIVLGSWQPAHLATKESIAHGEVHGYRLHCWASILGEMEDVFRDPASVKCARRVNEIAEKNWKVFCSDQVQDMQSHLIPYPVSVGKDGSVEARPERGYFLDTNAKVTGTKSSLIPDLLTT